MPWISWVTQKGDHNWGPCNWNCIQISRRTWTVLVIWLLGGVKGFVFAWEEREIFSWWYWNKNEVTFETISCPWTDTFFTSIQRVDSLQRIPGYWHFCDGRLCRYVKNISKQFNLFIYAVPYFFCLLGTSPIGTVVLSGTPWGWTKSCMSWYSEYIS